MGEAIPNQHPAVVLRSHFNQLRALLAVALIAVVGLTIAVVVLANDDEQASDANRAVPIGQLNYGGFNPMTGSPDSVAPSRAQAQTNAGPDESAIAHAIGTADDGSTRSGGPDESVVANAITGR